MIAMPIKPMVGARVPKDWADEIAAIALEKGCTSSQIISEAIALYLEKTNHAVISTHEARISALETRIARVFK